MEERQTELKSYKCRLCFIKCEDTIDIFSQQGDRLNIASILTQHFWFETKVDDKLSNRICLTCWWKVENFHVFYTKVYDVHNSYFSNQTKIENLTFDYNNDYDQNDVSIVQNNQDSVAENYNFNIFKTDKKVLSEVQNIEYKDELQDITKTENWENDLDDNNTIKYDTALENAVEDTLENETHVDDDDITTEEENDNDEDIGESKNSDLNIESSPSGKKSIKSAKQERLDEDQQIRTYFKMECELCAHNFYVFQDVKTHYRKDHSENGYLTCCDKKFYKRVYVLEHIKRHINPDLFRCQICNKLYADKRCLMNHMDCHRPAQEKPYKCTKCTKSFAKKYKLDQHQIIHMSNDQKSHFCDECGKVFATNSILQAHKRGVHDGAYIHICEICAKVFKSKMFYEKHCQTMHSKVAQPKVQCQQCGVWLKHEHSLRSHMRRHEESNTSHECNICGKKAPNRDALRSHKKYVHLIERSHKCNMCEKSFKQAISLKEHMTIHTGEILYTCPHCPKTFNSSANMHSHRKKMHLKEWQERRNKM